MIKRCDTSISSDCIRVYRVWSERPLRMVTVEEHSPSVKCNSLIQDVDIKTVVECKYDVRLTVDKSESFCWQLLVCPGTNRQSLDDAACERLNLLTGTLKWDDATQRSVCVQPVGGFFLKTVIDEEKTRGVGSDVTHIWSTHTSDDHTQPVSHLRCLHQHTHTCRNSIITCQQCCHEPLTSSGES